MVVSKYDPGWVKGFYDDHGMREWNRWESGPATRIAFAVHTHYLAQYIKPGQRILEIGAGAGRFTQVLAGITSHITVADISPVQLALNRQQGDGLGFASAIEDWVECDACDLKGVFADGAFDAVVVYGGLISYLYDKAGEALNEMQRVTQPCGYLFLEVASLWGAFRHYLPDVIPIRHDVNRQVIDHGDLDRELGVSTHYLHMYRGEEFRRLLQNAGLSVEVLSATSVLSGNWDSALSDLTEDGEDWQNLLGWEIEACREPGCVDLGQHIIAVCKTPNCRSKHDADGTECL